MLSRMDRYSETEHKTRSRSENNQELYKRIYDNAEYTNIERVVSTSNANEVSIDNIKQMLAELENEQKRRQIVKRNVEEPKLIEVPKDDDRSYDIRDIMAQAKNERPPEQKKYRSLKNAEFNILNNIDLPDEKTPEEKEKDLEELMHTLTNAALINKMGDKELSLDLLDDLKSETMIEDSKSIRAIIEEEMEKEREKTRALTQTLTNDLKELQNNFGLDSKDFDNDNDSKKKGNKFLVIATSFLVTVAAIALIVWIVIQIMNS